MLPRQAVIPALVRVKPGALDRVGIYAERERFRQVMVFFSEGLNESFLGRLDASLAPRGISVLHSAPVESVCFEHLSNYFQGLPVQVDAIIGLGGGKALDVAKYIGFLSRLPYLAVPTSLSNRA